MRCHFSETDNDGETNPPAYNIWTSGTLQTPNILKSILNRNVQDQRLISENASNFCSLDVASPSQKRKIDCEKEDIEERFFKIQRKKQLQKVSARANLVVDDQDDSDEEEKMYQQMRWIEKENAMNFLSSDETDDFIDHQQTNFSILRLPKFKWKDERRRLLRISMAKIQGVEDPEAYLRRSVLINNTVKRLQKDVSVSYRCSSPGPNLYFQGNSSFQNDEVINSWESRDFKLQNSGIGFDTNFEIKNHSPSQYSDVSSLKFHLACTNFSSGPSLDVPQPDPNDPTYCSSPYEEQRPDTPLPSLVIKPPCGLHVFTSQPCGLQYRNPTHPEDCRDEYPESPSSSILDSVVYHSLVTSLET